MQGNILVEVSFIIVSVDWMTHQSNEGVMQIQESHTGMGWCNHHWPYFCGSIFTCDVTLLVNYEAVLYCINMLVVGFFFLCHAIKQRKGRHLQESSWSTNSLLLMIMLADMWNLFYIKLCCMNAVSYTHLDVYKRQL